MPTLFLRIQVEFSALVCCPPLSSRVSVLPTFVNNDIATQEIPLIPFSTLPFLIFYCGLPSTSISVVVPGGRASFDD